MYQVVRPGLHKGRSKTELGRGKMSKRLARLSLKGAFACAFLLFLTAVARAAVIERVSVSTAGEQANLESYRPAISGDGRFVAFWSKASNLVAGDTNERWDVFVHDRQTGATERVSVSSAGEQSTGDDFPNGGPAISGDGRFVAFGSPARYLVAPDNEAGDVFVRDRLMGTTELASVDSSENQTLGSCGGRYHRLAISADGRYVAFDTTWAIDVYVRDRVAGTTERASVSSSGERANQPCISPSMSADGRYVAFMSQANNLVPGDSGWTEDVFVHDRTTGITERVSVSSSEEQANDWSFDSSVSADGRCVAFQSWASNLVGGDTNGKSDVFLRDRVAGTTERVSVSSAGGQGNDESHFPSISADGRYVAFYSLATNLVEGDVNGVGDVFLRDRQTGTTQLVSLGEIGWQGDRVSGSGSIGADGGLVAFGSNATNLVPDDWNQTYDIFVRQVSSVPLAQPAILINQGASCTNRQDVTLTLAFPTGSVEMRMRNDPGDWGAWEPCAGQRAWALSPGEGTKRVCVQCRDAWGTLSQEACAETLLETTPPTNITLALQAGGTCAYSENVRLTVSADDAVAMRFTWYQQAWLPWQRYDTTAVVAGVTGRGWRQIRAQFRDRCGNESAPISLAIWRILFDDITCNHPQRPYIEALALRGITGGCRSRWDLRPRYCPDSYLTRAQMAKFLCLAAGKEPLNREVPTFADVSKKNAFYGYIERLADATSWGGTPPTTGCREVEGVKYYCPNGPVTREEMAACLVRAAGKTPMPSCSGQFCDVSEGGWACPYIERLADSASWPGGVPVTSGCACASGCPPGSRCYCPTSPVTRGQMAVFLVRAFGIPTQAGPAPTR
jgi:Tol biopolymer transport system component